MPPSAVVSAATWASVTVMFSARAARSSSWCMTAAVTTSREICSVVPPCCVIRWTMSVRPRAVRS
ncbi:hypothetical protein WBK50_02625 [Pseudonocardia sp. T1-2H]|uniref:hypothetical protein n=1 Tax=Pseudonocardia sp. T1-2H TaxID=3128899 RepID=UPI0031017430